MATASARLQVHPTSVTNTVDRLEAAQLVKRVPHPSDRRATLIEITDAGRELAARVGDLDQGCPAIARMRYALDQLCGFESVDGVGDTGRVDLQSGTGRRHGQRTRLAETEQCQQFVAGEGQSGRAQGLVDPRHHDLLGPHQGGHRGHTIGDIAPAV